MKKKNSFVQGEHTVVGEGTVIDGNITAPGTVRIDGLVNGDVLADGAIVVGSCGNVKGSLKAADASIGGTVTGNVDVSGKVELTAKAKLCGDIHSSAISIEETAVFQGSCHMEPAGSDSGKEETDD